MRDHARKPVTDDPPRLNDVAWIHGSPSAKHNTDPDLQVHVHDDRTIVLRQNMAVDYEGPFLFLLFGRTRAVLIDTGATSAPEHLPLRRVVDELVDAWLSKNRQEGYELLVLHTHAHGDHVAGDGQFVDRPATTVVDAHRDSAWAWYAFSDDLDRVTHVDLGERALVCIPSPGHHESAVSFYDPHTGWLLTGDTVYPGRLGVQDWPAYRSTLDRLLAFAESQPVTAVVGCHIEMTTQPGVDYPIRTTYQPDEAPLPMSVAQLRDVRAAVDVVDGRPGRHVFADFVIEHHAG